MTTLQTLLSEIKSRAEASSDFYISLVPVYDSDDTLLGYKAAGPVVTAEQAMIDAEFCVESRKIIPALLAVIEKLIEQRDVWINISSVSASQANQSVTRMNQELAQLIEELRK